MTFRPAFTPSTTLTGDDLPTLRRMAAHYRARAAHRGWGGAIICRFLAGVCDRTIRAITEHGEMRPEIDYHRAGTR